MNVKSLTNISIILCITMLLNCYLYDLLDAFCGLCLKSHHYTVQNDKKGLLFTGIQQMYRFGSANYRTGSQVPLLIYHLSHDPILEMHFGAPALFQFTPAVLSFN